MKKLWREIKYWSQLLSLPLYGLSFLMPRNKKLWVMGSTFGTRFADNPKYFYLYLKQYRSKQLRAVWISKNKEVIAFLKEKQLEGYYLYSIKGIWYSLRAKVYLYDNYSKDVCFPLSGGAVKINLWHGIPLKKIQKDNLFDHIRNPRTQWEDLHSLPRRISDEKPTDYVLATSNFLVPYFSSAFQTERVLVSGYPRNDCILHKDLYIASTKKEQETFEKISALKQDKKLVLYMPTFRESETKFFDVLDLNRFEQFLKKENIVFLVKLHPKSKLYNEFLAIEGENILIIDRTEDPYPLLKHVELLITDYSSIYFDFLLTGKPIIFFAYDLSEYLNESRELYFDYDSFTPGQKVYNEEELEMAMTLKEDQYTEERNKLRGLVFDNESSTHGSEYLYHEICELINLGKEKL